MRKLAVSLFAVGLALALPGCAEKRAPEPEITATIPKGTTVRLGLLRQLEAGKAEEGSDVPFIVVEDVADDAGNVLISRGQVSMGKVTWSRSEGTLSGLLNQPARLEVRFGEVRAIDGQAVPLCVDPASEVGKPYAFTRSNTGKPWDRKAFREGDEMERRMVEALASSLNRYLETGDPKDLPDAKVSDWLRTLIEDPEMTHARGYLRDETGRLATLGKLLNGAKSGSIQGVTGAEVALAFQALQEIGRLANGLDRAISGRLKGRTIKAYVGTEVDAKVASDVPVRLAPKS